MGEAIFLDLLGRRGRGKRVVMHRPALLVTGPGRTAHELTGLAARPFVEDEFHGVPRRIFVPDLEDPGFRCIADQNLFVVHGVLPFADSA